MSIIKKVNVKDFDKEKFMRELSNNGFRVEFDEAYLLKPNLEDWEYVADDDYEDEEYLKRYLTYLLSGSNNALYLPVVFDYPEEYIYENEDFKLFSMDYFVESGDDYEAYRDEDDEIGFYEKYEFRGCVETAFGERFYGDDESVNFGDNNSKALGVVVTLEDDEVVFRKAAECYFSICQEGIKEIDNAGQFEDVLKRFVDKIS